MAMPAESAKRWTAAEVRRLNEESPLPWRGTPRISSAPLLVNLIDYFAHVCDD